MGEVYERIPRRFPEYRITSGIPVRALGGIHEEIPGNIPKRTPKGTKATSEGRIS